MFFIKVWTCAVENEDGCLLRQGMISSLLMLSWWLVGEGRE